MDERVAVQVGQWRKTPQGDAMIVRAVQPQGGGYTVILADHTDDFKPFWGRWEPRYKVERWPLLSPPAGTEGG